MSSASNTTESVQADANSASTATFTTALVFNAAVFGAELGAFTILRPYFTSIYQPRTLSLVQTKRVQAMRKGLITWPWTIFRTDYRTIQRINGMDAYFFVRFLRMMVRFLLPVWIVSWAILLPVTRVGTAVPGKDGLDKLTYGNVAKNEGRRYWAHLVLAWAFTFWLWYNIKYEMRHFIITRQQYLIEPTHSASVQANTVLITGIPSRFLNETSLRAMFAHLPGGLKTVWINRDLKELPELYDRRNAACSKLESAETSLMATAAKLEQKRLKAEAKAGKKGEKAEVKEQKQSNGSDDPEDHNAKLAAKYVPKDKRPTHRLPWKFIPFSLPLIGEKVDTIDWCKAEIEKTSKALDEGRARIVEERDAAFGPHKNVLEKVPVVGGVMGNVVGGVVGGVGQVVGKAGGVIPVKMGDNSNPFDKADKGDLKKQPEPDGREPGVMDMHADGDEGSRKSAEVAKAAPRSERQEVPETTAAEAEGARASSPTKPAPPSSQTYPPLSSAFLTFYKQSAAHLAAQALAHHEPYRMSDRYIEVAPEDVIWSNLGMNPYEAKGRMVISWALTAGLIILWAFPVAFVGIVSNVYSLCSTYHWLAWLCKLPAPVVGIIAGILPPVLLAVLMMLLPIVLRLMARFEGIPKRTGLELSLMTRFFTFQVIHGFLIVTISSGIISALPGLVKNPTGIPSLLASKLPQASTFFLTYVILQGLSGTAGGFLQIVTLVLYYVKLILLGSTARSIFNLKYGARTVAWGTLFPSITLLVVITLGYSIISPVINGLAFLTFFLFYLLYKYLFTWVYEMPHSSDTGGLFFPKALQHVFVGMYVQQVCLCGLFFLAQDENNKANAVPEAVLMIVLIIFTAFYQLMINNSYGPLIHYLPLSIADRTFESGPEDAAKGKDVPKTSSDNANLLPAGDGDADGELEEGPGTSQDELPDKGTKRDKTDYGFAQPAASRPQPIVWIPRDTLGIGLEEERMLRAAGVDVSMDGADMNEKGKVEISGPPPGLEETD